MCFRGGAASSVPKTRKRRSEQEFQDLLRRLELAVEASQIGVWEHSIGDDKILWDDQMHRLYATGRKDRMVSAETWTMSIHPDDRAQAEAEFDEAIGARSLYNSQFRIVWPNGEIRHMRSRAHFYEGPGGIPSFIGAEWDITADVLLNRELAEQKSVAEARAVALEESNARIEYAADHDYLTGLPNRRYFDRRLAELGDEDGANTAAILHIDLDRFKQINDKSGHAAGDAMLRNTAARISDAISEADMVARIGGDEFVVLLVDFGGVEALRTIAGDILERLSADIHFGPETLQSGASIGVAWGRAADAGNLLAESDLALYQAKKLGRNRVEFFTLKLQSDLQGERQLAEELKLALSRQEIVPYYQIQVDARTRQIFGLEALARWHHPERGLLLPGVFMKIADEYGLTADVDAAILNQALRDRREWERHGIVPPRIAVNISGSRLNDPQLIEGLARLNIPPHAIVFELVETIFLDDTDESLLLDIDRIKKMGIDIEIDDFGSGHASLIGLVKLKPKRLKIDRQLVTAITVSDEQRRLVASIVEIARALNVEVIAEGVETEEHARLLARIGCDGLQGYALGYPSSAAQTKALLSSDRRPVVRESAELQSAHN
ncbi:EAL domain-containing protein [Rhizobium sp. BK376]|uniref:putative bifunctional diguanylate cyclase/phosphodiesterase n=1 Tax=Rhizobium sp. BK376 TaxID=2512149 RepID=UPI001043C68B|nr:EAL domain-containing protein [Rhizobium sp. BK376]